MKNSSEREVKMKNYIDPKIIATTHYPGFYYTRPTFFERVKIFFRLMKFKPKKIKRKSLFDEMPKVKYPKFKWHVGDLS